MKTSDFWLSVLASLLANIITYSPLLIIAIRLWHRNRPVLQIWGIPLLSRAEQRYTLVMSSHLDQLRRQRPAASEQEAMVDLRDFFRNYWLNRVCRVTLQKPLLSENTNVDSLEDGNLVLMGGPGGNKWTQQHLTRLESHNLPYTFRKNHNSWVIWNAVEDTEFAPEPNVENQSLQMEANHSDYGLIIRAPNTRNGSTVMIFAGTHSTGTRATVKAALTPHLCREIFTLMDRQHIRSDFFVALVLANVREFVPDEPRIIDVKPITANPSPVSRPQRGATAEHGAPFA